MKCKSNRCGNSVFDELERGFQELVRGVPKSNLVGSDDPRLTVFELENRYVIECDLPGVSSENIALQVEDNVLTISGKRQPVAVDEKAKIVFNERSASEFIRRVRLARHVDQAAIDAELKNGVLSVTIPKRAEVQPQKIVIKAHGQNSSAS